MEYKRIFTNNPDKISFSELEETLNHEMNYHNCYADFNGVESYYVTSYAQKIKGVYHILGIQITSKSNDVIESVVKSRLQYGIMIEVTDKYIK